MDDEVGGPVGAGPVVAEQGLEVRGRSGLGAAHPGTFLAARSCHGVPTIRGSARKKSIRRPTRAGGREVHTIPPRGRLPDRRLPERFHAGRCAAGREGRSRSRSRSTRSWTASTSSSPRATGIRADHGSFAGVEVDAAKWRGADPPSIWPVHCVAGTPGAELHPDLERAKIDVVIDKGQDPNSQGYSGFQDTRARRTPPRAGRSTRLFVAGLATDYCVKSTVLDARREGFDVTVVEDAVRGVDVEPGDSRARARGDGAVGRPPRRPRTRSSPSASSSRTSARGA